MNYSKECECEKFVCVYSKMKEVRTEERKRIIEMMKEKDWCASESGGRGSSSYGGKRMAKYNLDIWK